MSCPSPPHWFGPPMSHSHSVSTHSGLKTACPCLSLLPPSPQPAEATTASTGAAEPERLLAALPFPVRTAEARPRPRLVPLGAGGSCSQQQPRMLSLRHHSPLPSLSPPFPHSPRCHSCHPCPTPEGHGAPLDHLSLGASHKDGGSVSYEAKWENRSGCVRLLRMEKLLQAFSTSMAALVVVVAPGCAACHGVLTCLSPAAPPAIEGLGDGDQHPSPTQAAALCSITFENTGISCSPQSQQPRGLGDPRSHPQRHCHPQILT